MVRFRVWSYKIRCMVLRCCRGMSSRCLGIYLITMFPSETLPRVIIFCLDDNVAFGNATAGHHFFCLIKKTMQKNQDCMCFAEKFDQLCLAFNSHDNIVLKQKSERPFVLSNFSNRSPHKVGFLIIDTSVINRTQPYTLQSSVMSITKTTLRKFVMER